MEPCLPKKLFMSGDGDKCNDQMSRQKNDKQFQEKRTANFLNQINFHPSHLQ